MATYLRPGSYVEEYLNPLNNIRSNPGVSVAAFVGASTLGGPAGPTLVASWAQYQSLFGALGTGNNDELAYAIYTFFANGGTSCYVVRGLASGSTPAALMVMGSQSTPANTVRIKATAPGVWSSSAASPTRVFITITHAPVFVSGVSQAGPRFDLTVEVGSGYFLKAREEFTDLSMNPADERNALKILNSTTIGSKFITLVNQTDYAVTPYSDDQNPVALTKAPLTGGTEGTGPVNLGAAVPLLTNLEENLVINVPGGSPTDVNAAVSFAQTAGRHFVVTGVPKPAADENADQSVTSQTAFVTALATNSSYVAVYGPWLWIADPATRSGGLRLTDPAGSVMGQYIHTDAFRGVFKTPAGIQTTLNAVVSPYLKFTTEQQNALYLNQINVIKNIPGAGVVIWGGRTQAKTFSDRYVSVRRQLIALKTTLASITRFAVFENNDARLWALVEAVCTQYLAAQLVAGGLKGATNREAFYVLCDATINPSEQVDSGLLNIEIGVALQTPAEFVIIRLGQMAGGGVQSSESLDTQQ